MSSNNEIAYKQHQHPPDTRRHPTQGATPPPASISIRCSQPLSTNQTPHPTTKAGQQPEPPEHILFREPAPPPHSGEARGPVASGPNSVSGHFLADPISLRTEHVCCAPEPHPLQ